MTELLVYYVTDGFTTTFGNLTESDNTTRMSVGNSVPKNTEIAFLHVLFHVDLK